ncbi:hypothetical protein E3C22_16715 [Jiella endophytica]|uniref:Uncharacterized protein n=1 Tax=Jiella endophytica TaxID=2558362 RepID=A0A4Y8RGG2_9HYPH|nr:hypothetical protein [Jiella endophytica]TFF20550.1 hypothetical protein E3C22_16715 [Jiella endophytica]
MRDKPSMTQAEVVAWLSQVNLRMADLRRTLNASPNSRKTACWTEGLDAHALNRFIYQIEDARLGIVGLTHELLARHETGDFSV